MPRCKHCNGNIVHYWGRYTCLQCGRTPDHKCDERCSEIKAGGISPVEAGRRPPEKAIMDTRKKESYIFI